MNIQEQINALDKINARKKKGTFMYINDAWATDLPVSPEELKTGRASEYRVMKYLFGSMICALELYQKLNKDFHMEELVSNYNEKEGYYEDVYQYFIVDLEFDEETTVNALKKANCNLYLYYDPDIDMYFLGVGDLGMSREYIMSDVYLTSDYKKVNFLN